MKANSNSPLMEAKTDPGYDLIEEARHNAPVLGALLGYDVPKHQSRYFQAHRQHSHTMVLSPADHGKTTLFGVLTPLQAYLENPNIRLGYITANGPIAESILRAISETLLSQDFMELFGDCRPRNPSRWTMNEIICQRDKTLKDPTFFCSGINGRIINRRFDALIFDDICDADSMHTLESRMKLRRQVYEVIMPCLEPDGWILAIGSRCHYDDIWSDFLANPRWQCVIDKASTDNVPLWPERWSMQALKNREQEIGEVACAKRYMNVINPEGEATFANE